MALIRSFFAPIAGTPNPKHQILKSNQVWETKIIPHWNTVKEDPDVRFPSPQNISQKNISPHTSNMSFREWDLNLFSKSNLYPGARQGRNQSQIMRPIPASLRNPTPQLSSPTGCSEVEARNSAHGKPSYPWGLEHCGGRFSTSDL